MTHLAAVLYAAIDDARPPTEDERHAARREVRRRHRARRRGAHAIRFTARQLEQRFSMFRGCWLCGGAKETVDHVKPLSAGGTHCLSNLRPACARCNRRKGATWPWPSKTN